MYIMCAYGLWRLLTDEILIDGELSLVFIPFPENVLLEGKVEEGRRDGGKEGGREGKREREGRGERKERRESTCRSWSIMDSWLMWWISNVFVWVEATTIDFLLGSQITRCLYPLTTWTHADTHTHIPHTITNHTLNIQTHTVTSSHTKDTVHIARPSQSSSHRR